MHHLAPLLATGTTPGPMPALTLAAGGGGVVSLSIAMIVVLGIGAQWLAWRLRVPSILLLLTVGLLAGPGMRAVDSLRPYALDPATLLPADLLLALVGVSVGLILYEGGLTLRLGEVRGSKRVIAMLVTAGATATWAVAGLAAYFLLGLPKNIAVLLGAILIVTGPTVIGPLLNHIRPSGSTGPILKWEGIVIDPIGVLMAVLVFEVILIGQADGAASAIAWAVGKTIVVGGGLGALAAVFLLVVLDRYWVPDYLQNPVSLMLVVATFLASNAIQEESGLLATTVMGVVLANQHRANVHHILEFKENLRVLLISALFVVLAARLRISDLLALDWLAVGGFLLVLVLIARPACVLVSTVRSGLSWSEKVFLCVMAPRGIVAAAGSSIFALGLERAGVPGAEKLVPLTFAVIIGTVAFYGLAAGPIARRLGVSDQNPQGVLFIGASRWVRTVAQVLSRRGVKVLLVDTNRANIRAARMDQLPASVGNALEEWTVDELDLRGVGRALACTPNDEVNQLCLQRLRERFESAGLFRLPARPVARGETEPSIRSVGRRLFAKGADYAALESRVANGWIVRATTLSSEFGWKAYRTLYGSAAMPLFVHTAGGSLQVVPADKTVSPLPGDTIIALVDPEELFIGAPFGEDTEELGQDQSDAPTDSPA